MKILKKKIGLEKKLKFHKMWEGSNTYAFDIDPGSVLSILHSVPKVISFADKDWLYYFENGVGAAYYDEDGILKARESGLENFLLKKFQVKYFSDIKKVLVIAKKFLVQLEKVNKSKIGNDDLARLIKKGVKINTNIFGYYLACQPQYILGIEEYVENLLQEFVPKDKAREIFTFLSTPTEVTTIRKEEIDWLEILIEYKNNPKFSIQKNINKHYKKYYTLSAADSGTAWNDTYLQEKLIKDSSIPLEKLRNKLLLINNSLEKIKLDQKKIVEKYKPLKKILDICKTVAKIGHLRLEMRIVGWMPIQYHLELLAEETARRFSYNPKKIKFARVHEVLDLFDGKKIKKETLEDRSKNFLIFMKNRVVNIYGGKEANNKFKELVLEVDLSEVREFKGYVAMKGKVTGTALVLKWTDDILEKTILIKDSTILVAGQTRPQLMPLISKSKAIVTDEGGITSHAAIVSRELGIPCIIGTKIGTSVIKTGDLIEVDANVGIVRIIKRA